MGKCIRVLLCKYRCSAWLRLRANTIITGIGRCYRKLKEYNKSVESLLDMLHLDPYNPKIHYELALSYNEMKNSDTAFEHLQIATDIWKDADREYNIAQSAKKKLEKWSA